MSRTRLRHYFGGRRAHRPTRGASPRSLAAGRWWLRIVLDSPARSRRCSKPGMPGWPRPTGVDEHMWSRQADTYVAMLQYQGSGMVEGYIETATDREWAVRDELMAKAAAFASDEVGDLWQQSAMANLTLQEYVDENWPELTVVGAGVLAIEDATEKDPELRRLRQASAQASKQLAVQIRAELDVARHGRRQ
jgi:hypothetical protein